jgi:hypothetical protein
MANANKQFSYVVLDMIESAVSNVRAKPLNLGAVGGGTGGVGGPPGGFIGWLPQSRVAYDESELATYATNPSGFNPPSGWSLLDNLNHIRARLHNIESSGILIVDDWDGSPTINPTNHITFSGAVVTDLGGGHVLVVVSGGGGGSALTVQEFDGNPLVSNVDNITFSGLSVANLGSGDILVTTSGLVQTNGPFALNPIITPPQLTSNQNNWNPAGLYTCVVIAITTDSTPRTITGLEASYAKDGTIKVIENYGETSLTLSASSSSSSSANRFRFSNDIVLDVDDCITLKYNAYMPGWRCIGLGRAGVEEAPKNGRAYVREDGAWTTASGLDIDGAPKRVVLTDINGHLFTPQWLGWTDTDTHEALEFGMNRPNKIANAGKIGYETFGNDYLFIVGAGSGVFDVNRNVKIFDNLYVDNNLFVNGAQPILASKQVTNGNSHDHIGGDGNPITEGALSLSDVTTADASTTAHGLLKKLDNVADHWLNGQGNFTTPTPAQINATPLDGWNLISTTWTRTGNHTFTISGDLTSTYRKGTKIRYKDGGAYEYGVIGSSSFASSTTTVNLIPNTDYAMAAATITDTYISYIENPESWPGYFAFTSTVNGSGGSAGTFAETVTLSRFSVSANRVHLHVVKIITNKGSWSGNVQMAIPVAAASGYSAGIHFYPSVWASGGAPNAPKAFSVIYNTTTMLFIDLFNSSFFTWAELATNDYIVVHLEYEM